MQMSAFDTPSSTPAPGGLPLVLPVQAARAVPSALAPEVQSLINDLDAVAFVDGGVLWVAFPHLRAAADPRANQLPVHMPALAGPAVM